MYSRNGCQLRREAIRSKLSIPRLIRPILYIGLALGICFLAGLGCLTKTSVEILRVSVTPHPIEAKGTLYVATNEPVRVGVDGTDTIVKKNVGGYILVHKTDWKALVRALRDGARGGSK